MRPTTVAATEQIKEIAIPFPLVKRKYTSPEEPVVIIGDFPVRYAANRNMITTHAHAATAAPEYR